MVDIPLQIVLAHPRCELLNGAFHEAAHAVVAHRLGLDVAFVLVNGLGGGITNISRTRGSSIGPIAWTVQRLAGPLTSSMLNFDTSGSCEDLRECPATASEEWKDALARARELIARHWKDICAVAEVLLERGKLTGAELNTLLHKET